MLCKKCGQEVVKGAKVCSSCGAKVKKPIFKKWWFWVIIAIVIIAVATSGADNGNETSNESNNTSVSQQETASNSKKAEKKSYEKVDLKTMVDDLKGNALKAEKTYQGKYVEITGVIDVIDSDGKYISVNPVNKDDFDFTNVQCFLKNDAQRNVVMDKSKGDTVTIKGKITSIGELLGYSIDIDEIK